MTGPTLSDIQNWMMTAIASGGGLENGLRLARDRFHLQENEIVAPSGGGTSRLNIYARGYWLRLLECLRAEFPALRYVMGDELFDFFAQAYIGNHPSTSTTLFDLGAGFADFLQKTQSSRVTDPEKVDRNLLLPLDLAKLERARVEVSRARGLEGRAIAANHHPLAFLRDPDLKIEPAPCLRLVSLSFPLIDFLEAIDRQQENPKIPEPRPNFVAISRVRYRVTMSAVEPWQYAFLKAAKEYSSPYDCAVKCSEQTNKSLDEILAQLVVWFPLSLSSGFLAIESKSRKQTKELLKGRK